MSPAMGLDADWLRQVVREAVRELLAAPPEPEVREVALASDADLAAFVTTLLELTATPEGRAAVEGGAVCFRLAGSRAAERRDGRVVERGAVTEALVMAAAAAGERLVLRAGVVVTPLARDAARRLSVPIEREA